MSYYNSEAIESARQHSIQEAFDLINRRDQVILDTETTGLHSEAEIVDIAVIHPLTNKVILNTLVRPSVPIPEEATAIHGITNDDVKNAPSFKDIYRKLKKIFDTAGIIAIYNKSYDERVIQTTCRIHGLPPIPDDENHWRKLKCVMEIYSAYCGVWNHRYGDFRWQKLPGGNHRALGDCIAVHNVLKEICDYELRKEKNQNGFRS